MLKDLLMYHGGGPATYPDGDYDEDDDYDYDDD